METKVVGDQNTEDVTTTIECINDTKFQSIRSAKQLKDHLGKYFLTQGKTAYQPVTNLSNFSIL